MIDPYERTEDMKRLLESRKPVRPKGENRNKNFIVKKSRFGQTGFTKDKKILGPNLE